MIQKTEFGFTGSITDLPAWGTNPEMGFAAASVAVSQHEKQSQPKEQVMRELPLKLVIQVDATNGTTLLKGIEAIARHLHAMRIPAAGEVYEGKFWKVTVAEAVTELPQQLTEKERSKGRSESYYVMSAEDQWAEDKRLGILDWDGK